MRDLNIDNTFAAIRELPLEVEFARIEQLVLQQPPVQPSRFQFSQWFNNRNLFLTVLLVSGITVAMLVNLPVNQEISAPLNESSISQPVETTNEQAVAKNSPVENVPQKIVPVTDSSSSHEQKPIVLADVKKESALLHAPLKHGDITEKSVTASVVSNQPEQQDETWNKPHKHEVSMSSSFCNFGDDDAWIHAFVKAMKNDHIINDTVGMRFTITGNSLNVNGKNQDLPVALRYNDLYQSIVGERLSGDSKISLSVSDGSCSLSKSIDK
mgnify:CR=1 FL=1